MIGFIGQVLRMYDIGGKLLNGIKNMYVDSSTCVRIKGDINALLTHTYRRGHNSPAAPDPALVQRSSPINAPQRIKKYNISSPGRNNYL